MANKGLAEGRFGSVAMIIVSIDFLDLWQTQDLALIPSGCNAKGSRSWPVLIGNSQLIYTPFVERERVRK